jgi:hypothetical protein
MWVRLKFDYLKITYERAVRNESESLNLKEKEVQILYELHVRYV